MRFIVTKDYNEMSERAADFIAAQIILKPDSVLGLATGSTPIGTYERLVKDCKEGKLDVSRITTVNLDEYVGLGEEDDQSYVYFMRKNLFDGAEIDHAHTHLPDGKDSDTDRACAKYEEVLAQAGIPDIQLLGLGRNGHIGFNEPADSFIMDTHCVELTESTIDANKRFFASEADVPRKAITMGIRTIFRARKILVIASGEDKAEAVKNSFCGPVVPQVPASILQLHPDVTVIVDEKAAGSCRL